MTSVVPTTPTTNGQAPGALAPAPTTTLAKPYASTAVEVRPPRHPSGRPSRRRRFLVIVLFVVLLASGLIVWLLAPVHTPTNVIAVSGRIEGDDAAIAAKTSGRIREITVREGDHLAAGQVIAVLDDQQIRARERQAEAAVKQAEARVRLSQHQIVVLNEQLRQNELQVDQARVDARGRVSEAEARLAAAEAGLAQAEATYKQAKWDSDASTRLFERGLIAEQEARRAQNNEGAQAALVVAARRQVEAARGSLTAAQAMLVNPTIRSSQVAAVQGQILQAEADIAAAKADADRARALLEEATANRQDLQVVAPFSGTVATRTAEPGEVVMPGTPIVTLVNLSEVYLRAFVPEGDIGRVRIGQPARVYLDSAPTKPIDASVSRIDPQASFTPENTYFREDRVKQVVGVKLVLHGAVGYAKPGMPAEGEILVDGQEWPVRSGGHR